MLRIFTALTMVDRFSYREAIEEGCFLQLPLFGVDALTRAVGARGLADHPIGLSWEPLDREGLLPPVAYSRIESLASALHLTALEEESLILRDEHGYLDAFSSPGELAAVLEALAKRAPTEADRSALEGSADLARRTVPDLLRSALSGALGALVRSQTGL